MSWSARIVVSLRGMVRYVLNVLNGWFRMSFFDLIKKNKDGLLAKYRGIQVSHEGDFFVLKKQSKSIKVTQPIFNDVFSRFDFYWSFAPDASGGVFDLSGENIELKHQGKRMVFTAKYEGDKTLAVNHFDKLFVLCHEHGGTLDFTSGVSLDGFTVKTTPSIVLEGDYALREYNRVHPLKSGSVVFDCGAFFGSYSFFASREVGCAGRVFAFEPDGANYAVLEENLETNNVKNVVAVKKAIWSKSDKKSFMGGVGVACGLSERGNSVVDCVTLQGYADAAGLEFVDFVKMDIEGAEVEVVKTSLPFLRERVGAVAIASYHVVDGRPSFECLEDLFLGEGFACATSNPRHLTTHASFARVV